MKRLKNILGAGLLFGAAIAVVLFSAGRPHVLAHPDQTLPAATATDSHPAAELSKGTVVVGGSLNGSLNPPDSPWRHWLR
ncbi:MAG: hypothetical protein ABJF10_22360 [Chthoniobacter sp.]|uniref:hypothetical protein n=1 Tax=Chthoniobacter sp. TaxID=2510640 RepID=UPI0032A7FFF1